MWGECVLLMARLTVQGFAPVHGDAAATLLNLCEDASIPMGSSCGGFACCNACRVELISGTLSPLEREEIPFLDAPNQRLGCQARMLTDCVVALAAGC